MGWRWLLVMWGPAGGDVAVQSVRAGCGRFLLLLESLGVMWGIVWCGMLVSMFDLAEGW